MKTRVLYIIGFVFLLIIGCKSDHDIKDYSEEPKVVEKLSIISFKINSNEHSFSVIKSNLQSVDSLVICLFSSPIDYTNLSPKIGFKGSNISYRVNGGAFKNYTVISNKSIDYSYPNIVDFKLSNLDNSVSKVYRIIIDTAQPIAFNNSEITIPNIKVNTSYTGIGIDTWENVGNYPVRVTLRTDTYVDIVDPKDNIRTIFSSTLTSENNVNPKAKGEINVFTSNATVIGKYGATALFNLYFNENLGYLVYDNITNIYVKDIGYKQPSLTIKGTITE